MPTDLEAGCLMCGGTRLLMGGWMGPTPQRPFPDPCPECSAGMTPRERQVLQHEWLADRATDPQIQELLARMAVFNRDKYTLVLYCPYVHDPFDGRNGLRGPSSLLGEADLVIARGNSVVKDRYGVVPYTLSDTELRRIRDEAQEFKVIVK